MNRNSLYTHIDGLITLFSKIMPNFWWTVILYIHKIQWFPLSMLFFGKKSCFFRTRHLWNSTTELTEHTYYISGTAIGVVIYTGPECRATMNNSKPRSKVGLVDIELNDLTKILIMYELITYFHESWIFYLHFFLENSCLFDQNSYIGVL